MKNILRIYFAFLAFAIPSGASAEIFLCDGKWTNSPCAGSVEHQIKEIKAPSEPPSTNQEIPSAGIQPAYKEEPLADRYALARKLRKINDSFRSKGDVFYTQSEVKGYSDMWLDRNKPYSECVKEFTSLTDKLIQLNNERERTRIEKEKANQSLVVTIR